ncbi:hypothetical protein BVY01_04600 [bacterium I07]|nr:hypothetical protein BVY01_04600 [bacterium I07]
MKTKSRFHLKALLFDLDNTLILFDEKKYFGTYIPRIAMAFSDLISPDRFAPAILTATQSLLNNRGRSLNIDHFMNIFSSLLKTPVERLLPRFETFYASEYDKFQSLVTPAPGVKEVFSLLEERSFKLILATNPMWPQAIQEKRVCWAGLRPEVFDLIAHISNTMYCKPQIEYYEELCRLADVKPESCMMVGDDPVNDMIAGKLGMKTYLTLDSARLGEKLHMSRELRASVSSSRQAPDYQGLLADLPRILEKLEA